MSSWSTEQLERLDVAIELEVAVGRPDGGSARWTPVWVVRVGADVFVRTWYRRETGWYGAAVATGRARVRAPGVEADVVVVDLGGSAGGESDESDALTGPRSGLFDDVDAAYRAKYGAYGDAAVAGMVTGRARDTTLRLDPL